MNRGERRKSGIKTSAKTYTHNDSQIKQIKDDAVKELHNKIILKISSFIYKRRNDLF